MLIVEASCWMPQWQLTLTLNLPKIQTTTTQIGIRRRLTYSIKDIEIIIGNLNKCDICVYSLELKAANTTDRPGCYLLCYMRPTCLANAMLTVSTKSVPYCPEKHPVLYDYRATRETPNNPSNLKY